MPKCKYHGSGAREFAASQPAGKFHDYLKSDPAKEAASWAQQLGKEHALFRSFVRTARGGDATKRQDPFFDPAQAFLSPPARRPGLVPERSFVPEGAFEHRMGEQVRIQGMKRRKELNGAMGRVVNEATDASGRVYVDVGKPGQPKVVKVLPRCLENEGDDPSVPSWMPKGAERGGELGASHWSTTGIRTGFAGFGLIHANSLSQSAPILPALTDAKKNRSDYIGHRAIARTPYGGFFPTKDHDPAAL
eukprot:TRINITY_DN59207_c0_g1_i1.p1 TRINITY_DN59207_c0_g1~~TRINITY_DN59207_c0_g1_i1.p1  ORF type:complete len:248 (+),score=41.50 TRINITY_DN59207_c0_g1_i1:25-768(+)